MLLNTNLTTAFNTQESDSMLDIKIPKTHRLRRSLILGERLHLIYQLIPSSTERLIDIGCDHGRLGVFSLESGKVKFVLASDIREQPLQRARGLFTRRKLLEHVSFQLANGLGDLQVNSRDCVVIAGMGGLEISSILRNRKSDQIHEGTFYILHPTRSAEELRRTLYDLQFTILAEKLCREEFKIYPVFLVQQKSEEVVTAPKALDIFFGPILWREYKILTLELQNRTKDRNKLSEEDEVLLEYYRRRLISLNKMKQDPAKKDFCQQLMHIMHGNEVKNVCS